MNKLTTGLVTTISKIMPKPKPVNIYYHDITKGSGQSYMQIELNKFYEQMRCIDENNYETTLFSDLNKNCFNKRKSVLITFDDGFSSNYYYAFEILKRFNIKANIFLTLDFIGTENYLSWEMIKDMNDSGLVEFGAHTKSHTDARHIDCNNFKSEIVEVNEKVQQNCGYKVEDFCFPYGIYDKRTLDFFKDLGIYKRLYTSDMIASKTDSFELIGRIGIENEDSMENFIRKLNGDYKGIYYLKRLRRPFNYYGI